jgi:hypothetical protein
MSWFKRLCMFVFGLAGLASLVALSLTWVGPWTTQARSMLELPWYLMALEILVIITVVGLLVCLLVAIFYPRNPKETIVADVEGGRITVTRHAIVSQVRHVVESDGVCKATSIHVKVRKRGNVRVDVRVKPNVPIDIITYGEQLYARLSAGLAEVCGDSVKNINVVFTEPSKIGQDAVTSNEDVTVTPSGTAGVDDVPAPTSGGISLHMPSFFSRGDDSTAAEAPEASSDTEDRDAAADEADSSSAVDAATEGPTGFSWEAGAAASDAAAGAEGGAMGATVSLGSEEV